MKIKQHASGGIIYTPFVSSIGLPQQTSVGSKTEGKTSSKNSDEPSYWDKEFLKTIQQYALPSDYAADYPVLVKKIAEMQSLSNTDLFGGTKQSTTMADVLQVQLMANRWKSERETWEKASELVSNEKAGNEAAITSKGNIYVYSDKGITTVTPEEYAKDIEKYYGNYITNSELLEYRRTDVPHQGKMVADAGRVIGLQTIHKQLLDTIKEFDTESISEYVKRTGNHVSQSAWRGMKVLLGDGPDGYYKINTKSEVTDVNAAVKYLWDSIGEDGQAKLKAQTAIKGGDPNKAEDRYEFILSMLQMHTDYSQDPSFEKGATEYDPDGKGNSKTEPLERLAAFAMGKGEVEEIWIVPRASEIGQRGAGRVKAMNFGNMVDKNDNTLPTMSVASLRSQAEYFKAAFNQDVTFGGQIVNGADENAILWDGTSQVSQVWLPYTRTENGQITPDFDLFFRYMDFVNELDDNPNRPSTEISKLVTKYRLNGKLNPDNVLELSDTMCFMTFSAYAHDDAIKFTDTTKRMTEKVSQQEGSRIAQIYENASRYGTTTPGKNHKQLYNFDTMQIWDKNDFRKGNVFIPIKSSFLGTYSSMKELVPESIVNNFQHRSTLANGKPVVSGQFKE